MLHGREYSKRILSVKPPNGSSVWTSDRPDQGACLAAAHVSKTSTTPGHIRPLTHDLAWPLPWIPP
jgi:hypothetical protein